MGLSVAVMFVTEVLLYLGCEAVTAASKPKRRSKVPTADMVDCQPVPHHVLWQKLDVLPSAPNKRLRATAATILHDQTALPVADQPQVEWNGELEVGLRPRHRRSHSSPVVPKSRTRRSELAYRRLIRSVDGHGQRPDEASNSTRGVGRRLRQLRRRLRRQPAAGPPAHQCHLERFWKRMSRGVFPPYVETGRCTQSTCMFGLYECTRRRYALKILRRVPRRCNPLPSLGANTTYEHVWRFAEYHVTVGCECARKRRPGRIDLNAATTTSSHAPHQ